MSISRVAVIVLTGMMLTAPVHAQGVRRNRVYAPAVASESSIQEVKELGDAASQSRANLIAASQTYKESLERLLTLQKNDEVRATSQVEKNRKLLENGLIAKKQLDESVQNLAGIAVKTRDTEKQIESIDQLIAEVHTAEQLAKMPVIQPGVFRSYGMLVRYVGSSRWAMSDLTKVDAFFRLKFSKPLPISAFGQTETHNRLGFDHRDAVDVAIHPDSFEGQELIGYLQTQGISFIAIRGAIPGSATGAHIHIGPPSRKNS
ncbi:MAG: hypothetical protein IPG76_12485 [Acidobacteria bacterium]|nr:hypothetical protein [Acidobacteriota bacterium]